MAKSINWEAIEADYRSGGLALRAIGDKYGVTEGAIRSRAKKSGWVRGANPVAQNGTQVRKKNTQSGTQKDSAHTTGTRAGTGIGEKYAKENYAGEPETKPRRGLRTDPPMNPFAPHNQAAFKHGAYARRRLVDDVTVSEARALELPDELVRLRTSNLLAMSSIGQITEEMANTTSREERAALAEEIRKAETGMERNTARIESIERTLSGMMLDEVNRRRLEAATRKLNLEGDRLERETPKESDTTPANLNDFYASIEEDMTRGDEIRREKISQIANRLGCDEKVAEEAYDLATGYTGEKLSALYADE